MAVPLFVLALLWQRLDLGRGRWLRGRTYRLGPLHLHTTSTVSGLVFVGIGVLFVIYDGTAGLTGADPATAAGAENTVVALGRDLPDLALLAVAGAVTVIVCVWLWIRSSRVGGRRR